MDGWSVLQTTKSWSSVVHSYRHMGDLVKGAKSLCPFERADLFREKAVVETCQPAIPEPLRLCGLVSSHNMGRIRSRGGKCIVDGETSHGPGTLIWYSHGRFVTLSEANHG